MDHSREPAPERSEVTASRACCDEVSPGGGGAQLSCVEEVVADLGSSLDLEEVLRKVADRVRRQVEYDTFEVLLLDSLRQELRGRFGVGVPEDVLRHWRFGLGQGIVGTAAKSGKPVLVPDVREDPRYIDARCGILSELSIPLIVKNRTIGVIDLGSRRVGHFNERHQRLLESLGGYLANAIENARLYENLREQTRTLSLLHEVSRDLTSILDRDELLRRVARGVKRLVDYQLFCVMLWNEESQLLEHTFSLQFDERVVQKGGFPLGYGICGTVAALRRSLRVPDVHQDPRYVRCGHEADVRSELTVPLLHEDRLLGVLDLECTEYNAFTEQHEQMLSILASYVAIALENARLYERVRLNEQNLETDLDTARKIQRQLLPRSMPSLGGVELAVRYVPALHLGGDFYDVLPYADGRAGLALGDVSGKATGAALYGSLAIGMLREHVMAHPCRPAEMLAMMNERLLQLRMDSRFLALLLAVYDPNEGCLLLANSGCPRPLLVRDGRVEALRVEGVPLGLLPDQSYEETCVDLREGDVIVFCSDGVHERVNGQEEEFGDRRLPDLIAEMARAGTADEIADRIVRESDEYANGSRESLDDRTVLVLGIRAS